MFSKTPFMSLPLFFFLDVLFDAMNKGQSPSTHHPGMEGEKKREFETKRETGMSRQDNEDGKVEQVWQAQERHRGDVENEGEYEANTKTVRRKRLHALNSTVTPPPPPTSCHSWMMTTPILSPPSVTSITRTRYCHQTLSALLHVGVCVCVYLIGYVTPRWGKNASVCKCLIVSRQSDKEGSLRKVWATVGLFDEHPFQGKPTD